jgi:hypothetical protein
MGALLHSSCFPSFDLEPAYPLDGEGRILFDKSKRVTGLETGASAHDLLTVCVGFPLYLIHLARALL